MYPFIRLIGQCFQSAIKSKIDPLEPCFISLRVLPNDMDTNFHMNNGRYLALMDMGRFDLSIRTGLGKLAIEKKWYPVLSTASIVYRKSLPFFKKYQIKTQILGWDEKWFYIEQTFISNDTIYASAIVKATFIHNKKPISTKDIAEKMNINYQKGQSKEIFHKWITIQKNMQNVLYSISDLNT